MTIQQLSKPTFFSKILYKYLKENLSSILFCSYSTLPRRSSRLKFILMSVDHGLEMMFISYVNVGC